jgi:hypothetical protein
VQCAVGAVVGALVDVVVTACYLKECGELYVLEGTTVGYLQVAKKCGNCEIMVVVEEGGSRDLMLGDPSAR